MEQAAQRKISGEAEIENAPEGFDTRGNIAFLKEGVQRADERRGLRTKLLLKLRALFAEMLEHSLHGSKRERVTVEGAGNEQYADEWAGGIAERPYAAI